MHPHALVGFLHLGHGMGFQTQLFSDKGLNEHLGSGPLVFLGRKHEINWMPGCRQILTRLQLQALKGLQLQLHFSETNQKKDAAKNFENIDSKVEYVVYNADTPFTSEELEWVSGIETNGTWDTEAFNGKSRYG